MPDLADVRGQAAARRALEVPAAGNHHLLDAFLLDDAFERFDDFLRVAVMELAYVALEACLREYETRQRRFGSRT